MLYWADPAASVLSAKSLVNNLDLEGYAPDFSVKLPYILDPTPNLNALSAAATRGRDNLNNMEQVVIDFPEAGAFQLKVLGTSVPRGPQTYWVVYEMISDEVRFIYPNGGEHFAPGQTIDLQWEGFGNGTNTQVRYSADGGTNWTTIGSYSNMTKSAPFTFPSSVSTTSAIFEVTIGARSDRSDAHCMAMPLVSGLNVTQQNASQSRIYWKKLPQAVNYEVFQLGTQYMRSIGFTADTNFIIQTTPGWVSVRPIFAGSRSGKRSNAAKILQIGAPNCNLSAIIGNLKCNQNGTPSLASDDTYTFDLIVNSNGQCGTAYLTNFTGTAQANYNQIRAMGPFPMSGGAVNVQITDASTPAITTLLNVAPPAACATVANPCTALSAMAWNVTCNQNGTPANATDDTFTFDVVVSAQGNCSGAWVSPAFSGSVAYGQTRKMGPYPMNGGAVTLNIRDALNSNITTTATVQPPAPCAIAQACAITATATNVRCNQNGTPSLATDDTYSFDVKVNPTGPCGNAWIISTNLSDWIAYSATKTMGPYPMSGGATQLTLLDAQNQGGSTQLTVQATAACATTQTCSLSTEVMSISCSQNGTPNIAADDTYTFELKVKPTGNCSTTWTTNLNDGVSVPYTSTRAFGMFQVANGSTSFQVRDSGNPTVFTVINVSPPANCAAQPAPKPDLELSLKATNLNPNIYGYTTVELTATNRGSVKSDGLEISFLPFSQTQVSQKISYVSHTQTKGAYDHWRGNWNLSNLAPGETATLTVSVFTLTGGAIPCFAQVTQSNQLDLDSSPNNNTSGIPAEDDEARVILNPQGQNLQSSPKTNIQNALAVFGTVFPNPASDYIQISIQDADNQSTSITLIDLNGKTQLVKNYATGQVPEVAVLDISGLQNGIYAVRIETEGRRPLLQKMVKLQE
jgi:hypothetical protein